MSRPIAELRIIPEAPPPPYPHGATDPELAARRRAYAVAAYRCWIWVGVIWGTWAGMAILAAIIWVYSYAIDNGWPLRRL